MFSHLQLPRRAPQTARKASPLGFVERTARTYTSHSFLFSLRHRYLRHARSAGCWQDCFVHACGAARRIHLFTTHVRTHASHTCVLSLCHRYVVPKVRSVGRVGLFARAAPPDGFVCSRARCLSSHSFVLVCFLLQVRAPVVFVMAIHPYKARGWPCRRPRSRRGAGGWPCRQSRGRSGTGEWSRRQGMAMLSFLWPVHCWGMACQRYGRSGSGGWWCLPGWSSR